MKSADLRYHKAETEIIEEILHYFLNDYIVNRLSHVYCWVFFRFVLFRNNFYLVIIVTLLCKFAFLKGLVVTFHFLVVNFTAVL